MSKIEQDELVTAENTNSVIFVNEGFDGKESDEATNDPYSPKEPKYEEKCSEHETKKEHKKSVFKCIAKILILIILLYLFICSLDILSASFRLLGGRSAGEVFSKSSILSNPVAGLMIGVLATVILQSSSTTTSILVSMVGSGIITVKNAIPIIMGANIGTSVTNTLVSLTHVGNRDDFRRAFAGATVHDVFNWLTVICLLPLELIAGYLYTLTNLILSKINIENNGTKNIELLSVITKPLTSVIIMLNKDVITAIALKDESKSGQDMIKKFCGKKIVVTENFTNETLNSKRCVSLFSQFDLDETSAGMILLFISLVILCMCLVFMVKILHSLLKGQIAITIKTAVNFSFPYPFSWIAGCLAIIVGALMTFLVQSSSVFTSALTPLVGMGIISLERMYPLTLGANIGTTATGLLASLAIPGTPKEVKNAIQVALCHLFFNISGILLWYPIPFLRACPITVAKFLGNITSKYRWFALMYIVFLFLIFPGVIFALSLASFIAAICFVSIVVALLIIIIIIKLLQKYKPSVLPDVLKTWKFLPTCLRSLQPLDSLIQKIIKSFKCTIDTKL